MLSSYANRAITIAALTLQMHTHATLAATSGTLAVIGLAKRPASHRAAAADGFDVDAAQH